ncbi:MAG: ABC transporter ATP-binding protein [Nanoarchaeota archaeon]
MAIITTYDLCLNREGRRAVDKVDISIEPGEIFGILGPTGCGKSSLLHILAGLLPPSSGTAVVNDFDVLTQQERVRRSVGVMFQEVFIDDWLTAREVLDLHAQLQGLPRGTREKRIESLLSQLGLAEKSGVAVRYFTPLKKRKLALARAVVHSPEVLILDEPTSGLPREQQNEFWATLIKVNANFKIGMVIATSSWEECEKLCDRTVLMDRGSIVRQGTQEALKDSIGGSTVVLQLDRHSPRLAESIRALWFVKDVAASEKTIEITMVPNQEQVNKITSLVKRFPVNIVAMTMHKPTLNDVFYKHTGSFLEDAGSDLSGRTR